MGGPKIDSSDKKENSGSKGEVWTDVVDIDVIYTGYNKDVPKIEIFRRTNAGRSRHAVMNDVFFYFYIPKQNMCEIDLLEDYMKPSDIVYVDTRAIDGNEVVKLVYKKASKEFIRNLIPRFSKTYEADIKIDWRFLLDNTIKFSSKRRICYFDIETDMSLDIINTPKKVLSIAVNDSLTDMSGIIVLDESIVKNSYDILNDKSFVVKCKTEYDLLNTFIDYVTTYDFDILCAYNLNNFDFPYIINRMKMCNVDFRKLSPTKSVYVMTDKKDIRIHCGGRQLMDYYVLVKKLYDEDKPEDFKLNTVGEHVLKIGKVKNPYKDLSELYIKDKQMFIEYNLQDVNILKGLENKLGFITKYLVSIQELIPTNMIDIISNSVADDFYILKNYNGKVIFPSKIKRDPHKFKGALTGKFIFDKNGNIVTTMPEKKMFSNIGVLDFSGLYPNLFRTFNISPETIGMDGEKDSININGITFTFDKVGLIPNLVEGLINLRKKYQNMAEAVDPNSSEYILYTNLSTGVKKINNSLYGFFGFVGSRLYDIRVAESVTGAGRMVIGEIFKYVENELNYRTLYFDTDSCFIQLKKDVNNHDEVILEIKYLNDAINKHVESYIDSLNVPKNYLKMEFEKAFDKLIFMGCKKRYLGSVPFFKGKFLTKNKIIIKGYDLVRSSLPADIKNLIRGVVLKILNGEKKEDIKKFYSEKLKELKEIPINRLAWSVMLGKSVDEYTKTMPSHVKAAYASDKYLGIKFNKNDSMKLIYIKPLPVMINGKTYDVDVIAFEKDTVLPQSILSRIDYDRIIQNHVINKLDDFFGVEGIDMEYIIGKNTVNLFNFFINEIKEGD